MLPIGQTLSADAGEGRPISTAAGEKKTVTFAVPAEKLALWDVKTRGFVVEPGAFEVMVGSSSEDIRARGRLEVR